MSTRTSTTSFFDWKDTHHHALLSAARRPRVTKKNPPKASRRRPNDDARRNTKELFELISARTNAIVEILWIKISFVLFFVVACEFNCRFLPLFCRECSLYAPIARSTRPALRPSMMTPMSLITTRLEALRLASFVLLGPIRNTSVKTWRSAWSTLSLRLS